MNSTLTLTSAVFEILIYLYFIVCYSPGKFFLFPANWIWLFQFKRFYTAYTLFVLRFFTYIFMVYTKIRDMPQAHWPKISQFDFQHYFQIERFFFIILHKLKQSIVCVYAKINIGSSSILHGNLQIIYWNKSLQIKISLISGTKKDFVLVTLFIASHTGWQQTGKKRQFLLFSYCFYFDFNLSLINSKCN